MKQKLQRFFRTDDYRFIHVVTFWLTIILSVCFVSIVAAS